MVGEKVRAHPVIAQRIRDEGHALGNHSDRHANTHNFLPAGLLARELDACQSAVRSATGVTPRHYRPPVGLRNPATHLVSAELGLEIVGWSVRSFDTRHEPLDTVIARVSQRLNPGAIVLLHDGAQPKERVCALTEAILDRADSGQRRARDTSVA